MRVEWLTSGYFQWASKFHVVSLVQVTQMSFAYPELFSCICCNHTKEKFGKNRKIVGSSLARTCRLWAILTYLHFSSETCVNENIFFSFFIISASRRLTKLELITFWARKKENCKASNRMEFSCVADSEKFSTWQCMCVCVCMCLHWSKKETLGICFDVTFAVRKPFLIQLIFYLFSIENTCIDIFSLNFQLYGCATKRFGTLVCARVILSITFACLLIESWIYCRFYVLSRNRCCCKLMNHHPHFVISIKYSIAIQTISLLSPFNVRLWCFSFSTIDFSFLLRYWYRFHFRIS